MSKKLGQHFLKSKAKIKKIVKATNLKDGDTVIEIGPGHGELTNKIIKAENNLKVIVIEKDRRLARQLKKEIPEIEIVEGDALKKLPKVVSEKIEEEEYKIVGNIPYYITGHLLRVMGELERKPETIVLTIQKEVADRIVSKPPNMNLLSASVQFWSKPEIITKISRKHFNPPPKVDSAVIKLTTKNYPGEMADAYYKTARVLFRHSRKTILNNIYLKKGNKLPKKEIRTKLKSIEVSPQDRPQNLEVEDIIKIAQKFKN